MQALIKILEGKLPEKSKCFFCEKEAFSTFGLINSKNKINHPEGEGYILDGVFLCDQHLEAFNTLLSGEHNIDDLIIIAGKSKKGKINLRR